MWYALLTVLLVKVTENDYCTAHDPITTENILVLQLVFRQMGYFRQDLCHNYNNSSIKYNYVLRSQIVNQKIYAVLLRF